MFNRTRTSFYIIVLISVLISFSCTSSNRISISGVFKHADDAEIYFQKELIHYKYADRKHFVLQPDQNGRFSITLPADSSQIIYMNLQESDDKYPLYIQPGKKYNLTADRYTFPNGIKVDGGAYSGDLDINYDRFLKLSAAYKDSAAAHLAEFKSGKTTPTVHYYQKQMERAKKLFENTPLEPIYYKTIGEYLVKELQELKYMRDLPGIDPAQKRKEIITEAQNLNFFTYKSLLAQRAGIRDFTNAYANTFGVQERLEKKYGQDLMEYDVKRLGYKTLDSARVSVLQYIPGRKAKAYSKMHLIAERMGEISLKKAQPSYEAFLNQYPDYKKYTQFLRNFHNRLQSVQPGQPAIPFTLPNTKGKKVSMKDFKGKYVLLDFWASWCLPCLNEFGHMKDLYPNYSRDDFEIVGISIEKDSLRWRQTLKRFDLPWIQVYGGREFDLPVFEKYQGGGIPFYILVNPQGNIARYNDVRPSFNLPEVLDSLMQVNPPTYKKNASAIGQ